MEYHYETAARAPVPPPGEGEGWLWGEVKRGASRVPRSWPSEHPPPSLPRVFEAKVYSFSTTAVQISSRFPALRSVQTGKKVPAYPEIPL